MKRRFLFLLLLLVALLLAACGDDEDDDDNGSGDSADLTTENAESTVRDMLTGNFSGANEYLCDANRIPDNTPSQADVTVDNVGCTRDGDSMTCTYTASFGGVTGPASTVTFNVEGDKLCGVDLGSVFSAESGTVPGDTTGTTGQPTPSAGGGNTNSTTGGTTTGG